MIKLEQVKKLIDEMQGLEKKSITDTTSPTADLMFYPSSGNEAVVKIYLNGCDMTTYPDCATSQFWFFNNLTDEENENMLEECIKALRECRRLRGTCTPDEFRRNKIEALRKAYETEMQELSNKYMKEIKKYEG